MFLKNLNHNSYKPLTIQDKRLFIATLNAVQKLALSMIANGVIVLPNTSFALFYNKKDKQDEKK